jgi:hypothetical protein
MTAIVYVDESEAVRAAEVESFKREFLRYAAMEDLSQPCPIGRLTVSAHSDTPRRQTIAEVVLDAIDSRFEYGDRLALLLCRSAKGYREHEAAETLLADAASSWADARVDV